MKVSSFLLRALNVRRSEWGLVQKLFLLQFFQGAGIAFFFTAAFSRFLDHFPVKDLAYVYVLSSFLLWGAGFVYSKLEHHLSSARLCNLITLVLLFSMVLFRIGAATTNGNWFYFLMLAWFNVLYLLNNLMFWGLAAQLYDVRQSKRLFGVISAGDIPAKFIGYSVALFIVSYTGTANLLLAGFICILCSFPFLKKILQTEETGNNPHTNSSKHVSGLKSIVKNYTDNTLIKRVAVLSLIISASVILINYGFYAEVKHAYKNDVEFARFIALFLASARLIALMIKILFTSRLLYWLGNRFALLVTPIIFISLIAVLLLTDMMNYNGKIVLYIFGLSAIMVDVLRSAINSPVLLTMMQPLATLQRLRAHNIVKGIMDPFAYFFCGAFLLIVFNRNIYSLEILVYVLLALALAWVIGIFRVHQQYLKTLIKTISSRYFSQEEFSLYDHAARELIENKINAGTELEVLYILKMLATRRGEESSELIIQALKHPSVRVINEALNLTGALHIKESEFTLLEIIKTHPSLAIRSEAIKVLSKITFHDDVILPLMQSEEKAIRSSAIIAVLNHSKVLQNVDAAEQSIKDLLASLKDDEKKEAALILCETGNGHFDNELIGLINEKNETLQLLAVKAMGHHPSDQCLSTLISKINDYPKPVVDALVTAREKSLPFVKTQMLSDKCFAKQKELLINAIGRIGGKASHEILLGLMKELPGCQPTIIKVLHRCHFKSTTANQSYIESLIREYLIAAAVVLHMQKRLLSTSKNNEILFRSLQIELNSIRDSLLFLFSFIYNREQISKVKAAMEINKKERNANAIELIDMTVKKEFANPFNAAFEFGDIEHRCSLLKNLFPKDIFPGIEEIFSTILTDDKLFYNNWTKACSFYTAKTLSHLIDKSLIHKYQHSDDHLLSQIAGYSVQIN